MDDIRSIDVMGSTMTYREDGSGPPVVFLHGNPTSSFLWRAVVGHVSPHGRCVAPDLIGMGGSAKLPGSGDARYRFVEHRRYLDQFLAALGIERDVVLVGHDWGGVLAMDWARRHPGAVRGIAYLETLVAPVSWSGPNAPEPSIFGPLRSPEGERMVLDDNAFIEEVLPAGVIRDLEVAVMDRYRQPYLEPGESRRATLTWARQIPIDGEPGDVHEIVASNADFMATSPIPKLLIVGEPGAVLTGPLLEECRQWPHQHEVTVAGSHFLPEDSPHEVGAALGSWVRDLGSETEPHQTLGERFPGADAHLPTGIPRAGWKQVAKRVWHETQVDQVPLLAAGVAFWSFMSLFPAIFAAIAVYGLVADKDTVTRQAQAVSEALPANAASLIVDQMETIGSQSGNSLNLTLVVSVLLALWTSSAAVSNIIVAINTAYDQPETRTFFLRKGLALLLSLGAIVFVVTSVGLITVAPILLDTFVPEGATRALLQVGRWVGLVLAAGVAMAVLYTVAPDRSRARLPWVSVGAVVATAAWLVASLGFSLYVDNFGSYGRTYGALAGVAILLLWLWMTALIVLVGAEINSEAEQQTIRDTTAGGAQPLGERGAVKADTRPGD